MVWFGFTFCFFKKFKVALRHILLLRCLVLCSTHLVHGVGGCGEVWSPAPVTRVIDDEDGEYCWIQWLESVIYKQWLESVILYTMATKCYLYTVARKCYLYTVARRCYLYAMARKCYLYTMARKCIEIMVCLCHISDDTHRAFFLNEKKPWLPMIGLRLAVSCVQLWIIWEYL